MMGAAFPIPSLLFAAALVGLSWMGLGLVLVRLPNLRASLKVITVLAGAIAFAAASCEQMPELTVESRYAAPVDVCVVFLFRGADATSKCEGPLATGELGKFGTAGPVPGNRYQAFIDAFLVGAGTKIYSEEFEWQDLLDKDLHLVIP